MTCFRTEGTHNCILFRTVEDALMAIMFVPGHNRSFNYSIINSTTHIAFAQNTQTHRSHTITHRRIYSLHTTLQHIACTPSQTRTTHTIEWNSDILEAKNHQDCANNNKTRRDLGSSRGGHAKVRMERVCTV